MYSDYPCYSCFSALFMKSFILNSNWKGLKVLENIGIICCWEQWSGQLEWKTVRIIHFSLTPIGTIRSNEIPFLWKLIVQKLHHSFTWIMNVLKSCVNMILWRNASPHLFLTCIFNIWYHPGIFLIVLYYFLIIQGSSI